MDLAIKDLQAGDTRVLRGAKRDKVVVPVRRNDDGRKSEGAHQPTGVIANLHAGLPRANQYNVRPKAIDLALNIVHRAEREDLMTAEANQEGEGASLATPAVRQSRVAEA